MRKADISILAKLASKEAEFLPRKTRSPILIQLRKFISSRSPVDLSPLISRLIEMDDQDAQMFFSEFIQIGMRKSDDLLRLVISESIEKKKYEILKEANRIRLIGRTDISRLNFRLDQEVFDSLGNKESFKSKELTKFLILRSTGLWIPYYRIPRTPKDIDNFVNKNVEKWSTENKQYIYSRAIEYGHPGSFEYFFKLLGKESRSEDPNTDLIKCLSWSSTKIFEFLLKNGDKPNKKILDIVIKQNKKRELSILEESGLFTSA